ncbi:MAG: DUF502 domain-containing protein [Balneolales bacterium]
MLKLKSFLATSVVGGIVVILPVLIFFLTFRWLYAVLSGLIHPFTAFLIDRTAMQVLLADMLVIGAILLICFSIGVLVKTKMGNYLYTSLEQMLFKNVPGYNMIRETIMLFLGKKKVPFSAVALARVFESETQMTAFVTDEHANGDFTVFIPTAPNPTSGNIYHLKKDQVTIIDTKIEDAMRTILACGAGSEEFLQQHETKGSPLPGLNGP